MNSNVTSAPPPSRRDVQRAAPAGSTIIIADDVILLILSWIFDDSPNYRGRPLNEHVALCILADPLNKLEMRRAARFDRVIKLGWVTVSNHLFSQVTHDLISEVIFAPEAER